MSEAVLLVERRDAVVTLTLNRPESMNALSGALRDAITRTFDELAEDDSVRVVILTGAGDRAFCAGLDLKELGGEAGSTSGDDDAVTAGDNAIRAMERCPHPIIGAVNGFAITGGFELALACDVLIAAEGARFADTHARVGIMPGWGLSQKLSRLIGIFRAKELSLTGNFLDVEMARDWGLVNRVVPRDALLDTCHALANDMVSCEPDLVREYKRVIDAGFAATFADGRRIETQANRARGPINPEDIAERRRKVQLRGRAQND
jgi:enoyl-CoA hydratase